MSEKKIEDKIKELTIKQKELEGIINKLRSLKNNGDKICSIGLTFDTKIICAGRYISVSEKNEKELARVFEVVSKSLNKLKIRHQDRVIVTLEEEYKEENIDLFVGYRISPCSGDLAKIVKKGAKLNLDCYNNPTEDYLVALDIKDGSNNSDVCSKMIDYANSNNIQILGPFIEIYDGEDGFRIYTVVQDLNRVDIIEEVKKEKLNNKIQEKFITNPDVIGSWKIREILTNIPFNHKKHKSNPDTKFGEIEFMPDGKTNYDNLSYSGNYLIINNKDINTCHYMEKFVVDGEEYLEIRMHDLMTVNKNVRPISYIYEKK